MKGRTWEEILTSRDEYNKKANAFYEKLKAHGVAFDNNKGESLIEYLQSQREVYKNRYSLYNQIGDFSQEDFDRYEGKLSKLKTSMDYEIEVLNDALDNNGEISDYDLQYFLRHIAELEELEEVVGESKISVERKERIVGLFGDFSNRKRVVDKKGNESYLSKTSQELTDERNERLAILNDLSCAGRISEEEFLNLVNSVVDCYNDKIDLSVRSEVAHENSENKEDKGIKKAINKVKNLFHKKVVEDKGLEDAKKIVNNSGAVASLKRAKKLMPQEEKFSQEADRILSTIPKIENVEVGRLLDEIAGKGKTTNLLTPMKNCYDGTCRVKTREEIVDEVLVADNYILKTYKHTLTFRCGENGETFADYTFEDPQGQMLYDEVCKVLEELDSQRRACETIQEQRLAKTDRIASGLDKDNSRE